MEVPHDAQVTPVLKMATDPTPEPTEKAIAGASVDTSGTPGGATEGAVLPWGRLTWPEKLQRLGMIHYANFDPTLTPILKS